MAFIIVAGILIVINAIFLMGSLVYTLKTTTGKGDPRLSTLGSVLDHRMSLQPQVTLYDAIVRSNDNTSLSQQPGSLKSEN